MSGTSRETSLLSWKAARGFLFLFGMFYFVIGFFSIVGVAMGQDVSYMPFWHAPWKWFFSIFM
jgi:hypothetical protein